MTVRSQVRCGVVVLALAWTVGFVAMVGAPAAGAAPVQASPPSDCVGYLSDLGLYGTCIFGTSVEVTPASVSTCQEVTVTVSAFLPGSSADVVLEANGTSAPLGQVSVSSADAKGSATFPVPGSFPLGPASAVVSGQDMFGKSYSQPVPVTVVACGGETPGGSVVTGTTTGGSLPVTGSDSGRLIGIGAGLIVLGAAAVYGARRSGRSEA